MRSKSIGDTEERKKKLTIDRLGLNLLPAKWYWQIPRLSQSGIRHFYAPQLKCPFYFGQKVTNYFMKNIPSPSKTPPEPLIRQVFKRMSGQKVTTLISH